MNHLTLVVQCLPKQFGTQGKSFNSYAENVTQHLTVLPGIFRPSYVYRVSQEECARLREGVPYVKVYRYNPKHLIQS
jgi:hypothetical protein